MAVAVVGKKWRAHPPYDEATRWLSVDILAAMCHAHRHHVATMDVSHGVMPAWRHTCNRRAIEKPGCEECPLSFGDVDAGLRAGQWGGKDAR